MNLTRKSLVLAFLIYSSLRCPSEFAGSRGTMLDEMSDGMSLMSASQSMTSASDYSVTHSSLPQIGSMRNHSNRLSPVRESHTNEEKSTNVTPERVSSGNIDSYFEMVAPPINDKPSKGGVNKQLTIPGPSVPMPLASPSSSSLFTRKPVAPARTGKSALTAMLAAENDDTSENPFTELYSAISGRSEPDSMNVQVFFPHAQKPAGKALKLNVRKDASMEEVLGFALWSYWEEGWQPRIDEGLSGEDDPKWATTCSALGWIMRLAEDDGEVDEDFPSKSPFWVD
jgi:target of rapamycin complex 2 subunit MAPKAP1